MAGTDCPVCWRAESTWLRWTAYRLGELLNPPSVATRAVGASADVMRAMLGVPLPTWYDRHRAAYILTGERAELERMIRHVTHP